MPRRWKVTTGVRPNTVTVYERDRGGPLHIRTWDPTKRNGQGNWVRRSLGHRDRERAKQYALEVAARPEILTEKTAAREENLSTIFNYYLRNRSPRKTISQQRADRRRVELFSAFLGPSTAPERVSLAQWERFCDARLSGQIDARGMTVRLPRAVRTRTVEADCRWLVQCLNWATKWRDESGRYLLISNPLRGFPIPRELNPKRPVATHERYVALRAVTDDVRMEIRWGGRRREQRSYLSELLDLANYTGRRIRAICSLRYEDLALDEPPYGAIRWPATTDKTGRATKAPIHPVVRDALDRALARALDSYFLFPSPSDPEKPVTRYLVSKWLQKAEKLAGLESLDGGLWHPFRRKWATERKHLPDVDVAAAGGWKSLQALKQSYQHADHETMVRVILEAGQPFARLPE